MDCFKLVGLLQFVTDEEHWNEELLLQFYATLHIKGYNRDPKTWVLEWMTATFIMKPMHLISLSSLACPL